MQPAMPDPGVVPSPYVGGVPYAGSAPAYTGQQYGGAPPYGTPYTTAQPLYGQAQVYSTDGGVTTIPAQPGAVVIIKGRSRHGSTTSRHDIRRSRSSDFGHGDRYRYD